MVKQLTALGIVHVGAAAALLAVSAAARAGGELPGYYSNPGLAATRQTVNHTLDEHIDPFSGMLQLHHVDMTIPGNGGFDLVLQRSFNGPSAAYGSISDTMSYNRTPNLGVGWSLLIGGRVFGATGTGGACAGGTQMSFETPDGHRQGLIRQTDGSFLSPSRWKATCVAGGVQVYAPNGTRYDMLQAITEAIPNSIQAAPFHYPTRIEDRNGNYATFTYTTVAGVVLLSSIATSDGRSLSFTYTLTGDVQLLTSVSDGSRNWTYSYYTTPALTNPGNGKGSAYHLERVQPPAGDPWRYDYILSGFVGAHSIALLWYPEGGTIGYSYGQVDFGDGSGNTTVVIQKQVGGAFTIAGEGNIWTYAYTAGSPGTNATTTVTSPSGVFVYRHVGYQTVGSGNLWQVGLLVERQSSTVQTETFAWDKQQIATYPTSRSVGGSDPVTYAPLLQSRTVSRNGATWATTYSNWDAYGNPQTIVETGERTRTTTRAYFIDPARWIVNLPANESITGAGTITRTFDAKGNLLNETKFGVSTTYTYASADGTLASRTDANGNTTSYSLYHRGIAQSEHRPAGVTIARTVDAFGNIAAHSDGAGNVYSYTYDGLRRMTRKVPPRGAATDIAWTGSTLRTATRGSYVEESTFDGLAHPYLVKRGGIPSAQAFDSLSRPNFQSLPGRATPNGSGGLTVVGNYFPRDLLGRPTELEDAEGNRRLFTYAGAAVTDRDQAGVDTFYHYWAFGDPDRRFLHTIALPNGTSIAIVRDDLGKIASVTQGSVTRSYGYNGSYFLTSMTEPETGTTTYGRDAVGNMTSRTSGGRTTTFTYDGLNRLTGVAYPAGSVSITYLGNGRTASITNPQATRSYGYDGNANLTSETLTVGAQSFTVSYTYDTNDALASITYPRTGEVVTYAPDALGRPTTAMPYVTAVTYLDSGNPGQILFANGLKATMDETPRQWPMQLTVRRADLSQPEVVLKQFGYTASGNLAQYYDLVDYSQSMLMTYDAVNQLRTSRGPWGTAVMEYDAVGNLTRYDVGTAAIGQFGYGATDNRLSYFNGRTLSYDSYGNIISDGLHAYQFDDASNLTCVDCGTGNQITYAYDGNNRRVSRVKGGDTTYYVHAANGDLLVEYTVPANVAIQHVYLHGKRIASKRIQL